MKAKIGTRIVVMLFGLLMAGCSSIRARDATPAAEWKLYPGVRQDVKELGEIVTGQRQDPLWVEAMVATMLVTDLPISTVFDTLVVPYDLYRIHRSERQSGRHDDP